MPFFAAHSAIGVVFCGSVMLDDHRCAGSHDHRGNLRLRRDRAGGKRQRRQAKAGDHRHLFIDDKLLRQALGDVGLTGIVAGNDFDLLAGDFVAVLLHVKFDRRFDLAAGRGGGPGHRQDETDFDGVFGKRQAGKAEAQSHTGTYAQKLSTQQHFDPPARSLEKASRWGCG
jgi:hypothetical protein